MIVDDYTRYTWLFFLVDKSDVFATFKSFIKDIHNEFETTIKRVRSDNGSEFKNTIIDELCDELGIRHQFSAKYTPQSNGLIERKNRTLIDMARSMLSEYNVSLFTPKFGRRVIGTQKLLGSYHQGISCGRIRNS